MVPEDMAWPEGVNDSKKLTPKKRTEVAARLASIQQTVVFVPAHDIDRDGMSLCLKQAFRRAIQVLLDKGETVSRILIDGNPQALSFGPIPVEFLVRGDAQDWRIGAASIIAKVTRDDLMTKAASEHPAYGWDRNMGYGSAEHQEAIRVHGLTPWHRATFCRRFLPVPQEDNILDLFI